MNDDLGTFLTELDGIQDFGGLTNTGPGGKRIRKSKNGKKYEYTVLGTDKRGVLSTHPKLKNMLDMNRTQGREAPVNFMPVMGKKPYDKRLFKVDNIETLKETKGLTPHEIEQLEREKCRQVLAEDLGKRYDRPKIKSGHTSMQGPGREDHYYTRFLYPKHEKFETIHQERLANQQAIEKSLQKRYPKHVIKGGWNSRGTTRDTHFYTRFVYKKEQLASIKRPKRSSSSLGFATKAEKFEYLNPYSTVSFDKQRAKVDHGLNQGDVQAWHKQVGRKPLTVIHHDLDYKIQRPDPHVPQFSMKRMTGREVRVIHKPVSEFSYTPGEYNHTEARARAVEPKIKGGKFTKVPARPKPKESYTALHGYDRIMKKLLERKRLEKRAKERTAKTRKKFLSTTASSRPESPPLSRYS